MTLSRLTNCFNEGSEMVKRQMREVSKHDQIMKIVLLDCLRVTLHKIHSLHCN